MDVALPPLPMLDGVQFRHVPGWPGYCVSDSGVVMSSLRGDWKAMGGTLLKGYPNVCLSSSGRKRRTVAIHAVVLLAFRGPRPVGMEARHFPDPSTSNNRLSNLQWGTRLENTHDKIIAHGKHPVAKLSESDVKAMREQFASGTAVPALAQEHHVAYSTAYRIVNRLSWRHV